MRSLGTHIALVKELELDARIRSKYVPMMRLGLRALMLFVGHYASELVLEKLEGA